MSYVEHCKKHGQYHGEICGECFGVNETQVSLLTDQVTSLVYENLNLQEENTRLNDSIAVIYLENVRLEAESKLLLETLALIADDDCPKSCKTLDKQCDPCIARAALEEK